MALAVLPMGKALKSRCGEALAKFCAGLEPGAGMVGSGKRGLATEPSG